jgi:erythromycin esterase-like protein
MRSTPDEDLRRAVARTALPLSGPGDDADPAAEFAPLLDMIGESRCVLIGEATHGSHEFYRMRAQLTKRLILDRGFCAVAVEADWPDAYRVNRYVRGLGRDEDAIEALAGFRRFPAWMWRNADVLDFVGWLRAHNDAVRAEQRAGFYGLDLYSLHASMEAVLAYLDRVDPEAARAARYRYACFEQFGEDPQAYGYATAIELRPDCEEQVLAQLIALQRRRDAILRRDGVDAEDEQFQAEQNAHVVRDAESYYRAMFGSRVASWNVRDTHMADTLDALLGHFSRRAHRKQKVVVWAHNSHVGDARATELGAAGELNLGQLARERHPDDAVLIGFSTFTGTVTAASRWDAPAERKFVREALHGSYENLFHAAGAPNFMLLLRDAPRALQGLSEPRLQRAIGVIYRPDTERVSHYFSARLGRQFDAVIHLDHTRALEPLERTAQWQAGELAETFPSGL